MYKLDDIEINEIELKCMLISKGIKVSNRVYKTYSNKYRINQSPLMCNCIVLPNGTICQMTDLAFHMGYLASAMSWENLKLMKYMKQIKTLFTLDIQDEKLALFYNNKFVCNINLLPKTDFYQQKTSTGLPFVGNSVLQGRDWVAFQCLWPCEFARAGKPCEFCYSGGVSESLAKRHKEENRVPTPEELGEIVEYAIEKCGCNSIQITGGSTFKYETESKYVKAYLNAINKLKCRDKIKEILLYITPPNNMDIIDEYFELGATKIACSVEVWDMERAKIITPGKCKFIGRQRYIDTLEYVVKKYGANKAFSNLIIGIESLETFKQGAEELAKRGIIPTASIWIPFGRPVMNSMETPDLMYYREVIKFLQNLYEKYNLQPADSFGLNVCIEQDIYNSIINKKEIKNNG